MYFSNSQEDLDQVNCANIWFWTFDMDFIHRTIGHGQAWRCGGMVDWERTEAAMSEYITKILTSPLVSPWSWGYLSLISRLFWRADKCGVELCGIMWLDLYWECWAEWAGGGPRMENGTPPFSWPCSAFQWKPLPLSGNSWNLKIYGIFPQQKMCYFFSL